MLVPERQVGCSTNTSAPRTFSWIWRSLAVAEAVTSPGRVFNQETRNLIATRFGRAAKDLELVVHPPRGACRSGFLGFS